MSSTRTVYIGMGTCGLASGAGKVRDAVRNWAEARGADVTVTPTGCIGSCSLEPILDVVNEDNHRLSFGNITPEDTPFILDEIYVKKNYRLDGLLGQHKNGVPPLSEIPMIEDHPYFKKQVKFVLRNCGLINPVSLSDYRETGGFKGLEKALSMTPDEVVAEVTTSGLRGRGGGGFPTGKKWQFAAATESEKKYVICNADEGDPGAFMDRSLLEGDPYALIEGMMIAGYAVGADEGIIYCRAEYPLAIERLTVAIDTLKEEGMLEKELKKGFSFSLRIKKGAGAFVCGEETALINSIEGKRGMPRPRPPYPAVSGLYGKPTNVNNVETYANVPNILREGADFFSSVGIENSRGTKVFALTGKINNPGLVEVPMGITLREIVYDIGGCIPAEYLDTKIDYDSLKEIGAMMGSGGIVVMDEDTCMVDVAKYFLAFTTNESCGKCIPCREGTKRMHEILEKIVSPYTTMAGEEENLMRFQMVMELENLAGVIQETSLCGLGQSAPNPVLSTLRYFRDEYEAHIYDRRCPSKACRGLLCCEIDTGLCKRCMPNVCGRTRRQKRHGPLLLVPRPKRDEGEDPHP
jgi:NADH-quinone oxidoreductase subunit F